MSKAGHMYTDLMGTTGFKAALDISRIPETFQNFIMGDSVFSIFVVDRHFFPVNWVTTDRAFYSTFIFLKITCHNSPVTPLDGMRFQLLGQITVSRVILAYKKSSCSVLINTVDDSRAHNTVNTG